MSCFPIGNRMTRDFCILADDLTGALDAAAPLAARFGPAPVVWALDLESPPPVFTAGNVAMDTGTRNLPADAVAHQMFRLSGCFANARIAFLKIDSLFRGHFPREFASLIKSGAFASALVAPAFPAQNRLTRDGQQFVADASGATKPVGENILHTLARTVGAEGIPLRHVPAGSVPSGAALFVCDAVNDDDLRRLTRNAERLPTPLLFVGSAGLARCLGTAKTLVPLPHGSRLVIAGSGHPITRGQIAEAAAAAPDMGRIVVTPGGVEALPQDTQIVEIDVRDCAPDAHRAHLFDSLRSIHERLTRPTCLMVSGGDTFRAVLESTGATRLMVEGEFAPGIATGAIGGGAWDAVRFVSKSGAFGPPDIFTRFLRQASARTVE